MAFQCYHILAKHRIQRCEKLIAWSTFFYNRYTLYHISY